MAWLARNFKSEVDAFAFRTSGASDRGSRSSGETGQGGNSMYLNVFPKKGPKLGAAKISTITTIPSFWEHPTLGLFWAIFKVY